MTVVLRSAIISLILTILGAVLRSVSGVTLTAFNIGALILLPGYLLRVSFLGAWIPIHNDSKLDYLANFIFYFLLILLVAKIFALVGRVRSH
jgi:hypothetical protein